MKNLLATFLSLLIPSLVFAQNQGDDLSLGAGGTRIFGRTNEARTAIAGANTKANYIGLNTLGDVYVTAGSAPTGVGDFFGELAITPLKVVADTAETASTTTVLVATAHVARVNDYIFFTAGTAANIGTWRKVTAVATDAITVGVAFPATPANGDAFTIYRPTPNTSIYAEDAAFINGDLVRVTGGVNARSFAAYNSTNGDVTPFSVGDKGVLASMLMYDSSLGGASSPIILEDDVSANTQASVVTAGKILAIPAAQAADADWGNFLLNDINALYTDGIRRGTFTHSNPAVANTTSVTIVASNTARRYLLVQNNSAANICISLNNATLTGIVPTTANPCIVLAAGAFYESPPNACPTAAITAYQASGGSIQTVTTVEAS